MKKWLIRIGVLLAVFLIALLGWIYKNIRDRYPDYNLNPAITGAAPGELKVGFAALPITPPIVDTWHDNNADAEFHEEDGDTL